MDSKKKRFSIKMKMYLFVVITVLAAGLGTAAIAFTTGANQIDQYYKQNTADNARNFASMLDGDFLTVLRKTAESEEYQQLRERAEAEEDESLVEDYLRKKGLWDDYSRTRDMITEYLENMKGIKYLYIVAHGDTDALQDMYLVDDKENPIYETGYYEDREAEFYGMDLTQLGEPTISYGDWGWLCSDFKPVYTSDGTCPCIVGCDIGMDDVMAERQRLLVILIIGAIALTTAVLICAVLFINKVVVNPLDKMTTEMKKFNPSEDLSYEASGVIDIDIRSNDEISEIYHGIRTMQINIIDYLKDLFALQEDKLRAENDIRDKEEQIGELNIRTYKDSLTGVGNKAAYMKMSEEINQELKTGDPLFAIVMMDMNDLKQVNDKYGHRAGDQYIIGCCRMLCNAYKHSPVFRVGGDEFVAILKDSDYSNRREIFEKLKEDYSRTSMQTEADPWLRYSAALGMAERASDDYSMDLVFRRADKAMYEDKEAYKKEHGKELR